MQDMRLKRFRVFVMEDIIGPDIPFGGHACVLYRIVPKFWTHVKIYYVCCDLSVREKDWRGKPGL